MLLDDLFYLVFPDASIATWHEQLPAPFSKFASIALLQNVAYADEILVAAVLVLLTVAVLQLRAFARPPPVPLKKLPNRPALSVQFKPDDPVTTNILMQSKAGETVPSSAASVSSKSTTFQNSSKPSFVQRIDVMSKRLFGAETSSQEHSEVYVETVQDDEEEDDDLFSSGLALKESSGSGDGGVPPPPPPPPPSESPFLHSMDLPDSFAPLLSSSHMELLSQSLTADLIHAVQLEAGVRLRAGRHEVPLDIDGSRPQLVLNVPADTGCRLSAVAVVGSDGLSTDQDLQVHRPTTSRSKPMVKHAGIVLDPPLPLCNVAPTLIHFPTLFEDRHMIPTLRSMQVFRLVVDFIISISSFLEKCLWILESQCQIHLSKVRITPWYKGRGKRGADVSSSPEWRLQLAFSGHVLLFGWIPIPFISVTLPTFIIPQPHALLEHLISAQPLASARLRRENIAEQRIALAIINTAEAWNTNLKVVATPPAIGVDVTLPGGVSIAMEMGLWRDHQAGRNREGDPKTALAKSTTGTNIGAEPQPFDDGASVNSMSSWTTKHDSTSRRHGPGRYPYVPQFDANQLVPWFLELSAKGSISHEKMSIHILKLSAQHEGSFSNTNMIPVQKSQFVTRGSFAVWKHRPSHQRTDSDGSAAKKSSKSPIPRRSRRPVGRSNSTGHPELENEDSPSVAAILMFPDETASFHNDLRMLQYDYVFDVAEDSKIDAVTVSVGATHPMLNGGTMVTTILDSIYAFGSVAARENSVLDPIERRRKRNILRHLPATDFTFGIQNIFIPPESSSYSDDGQTLFLPEIEGGRMMARFLGGIQASEDASIGSNATATEAVSEGVKLVADFEIASLVVNAESNVKEFPELDIMDVKLHTLLSGVIGGSVKAHLRPQKLATQFSTMGPNVFNPLEAYEIDFARSSLSVTMKEFSGTLGHRRVMFPAESTFQIKVIESIVDMGFEGKTKCDLCWDFQGLSPILQVTNPGQSIVDAAPENKQQATLLVAPLRQGRFSLSVSSVGGISITKAATSREDKEGLYDWKFFNALISPDEESLGRLMDLLHDKRTIDKLLQVFKLVNKDLHRMMRYAIKQIWRAKEILDQEGVSDPGHAIPMYKMARLISLFLTGDVDQVDDILPITRRIIDGDGLDVVKVKDLLRQHLDWYDTWAPEIDRAVRWAAVCLGPVSAAQPYVEDQVTPLAELPYNAIMFEGIPSARQLYETLQDKPQLPLDTAFSNLVSRVAPYLSFQQVEYILQARASTDWQPSDLRRIRYVYSIKRKVLEIAESYGGLSFLPQSFFLSVFLGEATRTSLRASQKQPRPSQKTPRKPKASAIRPMNLARTSMQSTASRRSNLSTLSRLRRRHVSSTEHSLNLVAEGSEDEDQMVTPAERAASSHGFHETPENLVLEVRASSSGLKQDDYELGDSLLGPQDVAILLQAGLTSALKSSTVVQLNQRMLLDLICSQPRSFAIAVLAEIGTAPRTLTSALMALLELDQTVFKTNHQIDMHDLLESWLPGLKIPRREDHMAGGRWARQSYYDALFSVALNILGDAESYMALKSHVQHVRQNKESDPLPQPREEQELSMTNGLDISESGAHASKITVAIENAVRLIADADEAGRAIVEKLIKDEESVVKCSEDYDRAIDLYRQAFDACSKVLTLDKHAFYAQWFREFYKRNYDALMIKSMYDNVIDDVDRVRYWLGALLKGAKKLSRIKQGQGGSSGTQQGKGEQGEDWIALPHRRLDVPDDIFDNPEKANEQDLVDAIIEATIYESTDRARLREDPLVRLLIPNPPGHYDFAIVLAAGVITEGKKGEELKDAFERIEKQRGVKVVRADTATARSFEYNASKIEEAIETVVQLKKPYGLLGYSQGCANALLAESNLLSGSPKQQQALSRSNGGLVCRQLLFSAANGSFHGPAMNKKVQQLISMCEDFFKSQAGYFSRALSSTVLETLNSLLDSPSFHKTMGGAQGFLPDGSRAFWREAQHVSDVPTCTLRGIMEEHTTPESLEMLSHLLTKQSGSSLHDSQVHAFDAVGYPVYHINRNGKLLRRCAVGEGAIQRTHHWSPLSYEVEFVRTQKDIEMASFDCAKDRHIFPWVEVNKRFGFIKFLNDGDANNSLKKAQGVHPSKLVSETVDKEPFKLLSETVDKEPFELVSETVDKGSSRN